MGLLLKILAFPVLGPVGGVTWIAEKLLEQAEKEEFNEEVVRGRLMELELRYDLGEISEDEFLAAEDVLLERMKFIKELKSSWED